MTYLTSLLGAFGLTWLDVWIFVVTGFLLPLARSVLIQRSVTTANGTLVGQAERAALDGLTKFQNGQLRSRADVLAYVQEYLASNGAESMRTIALGLLPFFARVKGMVMGVDTSQLAPGLTTIAKAALVQAEATVAAKTLTGVARTAAEQIQDARSVLGTLAR